MKNWKTTLIGAIGAAILVAIQAISTGTVDIKTIVVAGALAGGLAFAKDAGVDEAIGSSAIARELLPILNDAIAKAADNSSSPLLQDVHQIVNTLTTNVAALPAAVAAAIPTPSIVVDASTNSAAPAVIAPQFNRFSGKPLSEDPETASA